MPALRLLLGCLAVLALAATLGAPSPADSPPPPAPPADPVTAFLPARASALPEPPEPLLTTNDLTSPAPLPDLVGPSQAISLALNQAMQGLVKGQSAPYKAALDSGYAQTANGGGEIGAVETGQRLDRLLAKYQVSSAQFGLTSCRLLGPDTAIVVVRERMELLSRNTPPTRVPMPNGKVVLMNNTVRMDMLLVLRQDWARRGAAWKLSRNRTAQMLAVAVL